MYIGSFYALFLYPPPPDPNTEYGFEDWPDGVWSRWLPWAEGIIERFGEWLGGVGPDLQFPRFARRRLLSALSRGIIRGRARASAVWAAQEAAVEHAAAVAAGQQQVMHEYAALADNV